MCHGYFFFQPPDAVIYLNSPSIYGSAIDPNHPPTRFSDLSTALNLCDVPESRRELKCIFAKLPWAALKKALNHGFNWR